ncbi:hypothetical protein [Staphylococcus casei]|uniref:Uncharacterized protein n=1 Tax=Staphylococcus casei TaxID=201828 RepID=A0ABZ2W9V3_9STAP
MARTKKDNNANINNLSNDSINQFEEIYKKVEASKQLTKKKQQIESELSNINLKINFANNNGDFLIAAQQRESQTRLEKELLTLEEFRKQSPTIATDDELKAFESNIAKEKQHIAEQIKTLGDDIEYELHSLDSKYQKYIELKNELNRRIARSQYVTNELKKIGDLSNLFNRVHKDYTIHFDSIRSSSHFMYLLKNNFDQIEKAEAIDYITGRKDW